MSKKGDGAKGGDERRSFLKMRVKTAFKHGAKFDASKFEKAFEDGSLHTIYFSGKKTLEKATNEHAKVWSKGIISSAKIKAQKENIKNDNAPMGRRSWARWWSSGARTCPPR